MSIKLNNFLARELLRLLLRLHHDSWVSSVLNAIFLYYSFRCSPTLHDLACARSLQEHRQRISTLADGFRSSVYSYFSDDK